MLASSACNEFRVSFFFVYPSRAIRSKATRNKLQMRTGAMSAENFPGHIFRISEDRRNHPSSRTEDVDWEQMSSELGQNHVLRVAMTPLSPLPPSLPPQ